MKNCWSIDRLLKKVNVLQFGTDKNPSTTLYSDTKKDENFMNETYTKIIKREHAFKGFASTYNETKWR